MAELSTPDPLGGWADIFSLQATSGGKTDTEWPKATIINHIFRLILHGSKPPGKDTPNSRTFHGPRDHLLLVWGQKQTSLWVRLILYYIPGQSKFFARNFLFGDRGKGTVLGSPEAELETRFLHDLLKRYSQEKAIRM